MSPSSVFIALFVTILMTISCSATLKIGFYSNTCPAAEELVRGVIDESLAKNPGLGAGLIRLFFHDCFVRGCDGSVLLDSTDDNLSEKESIANKNSLRGFEVIDDAKKILEELCPKTVSCADILSFAARDAARALGNITYEIPSGRRDGFVSLVEEPVKNLPSPTFNLSILEPMFRAKNLSIAELVTLSGAHSVGLASCNVFKDSVFAREPIMDANFADGLANICPAIVTKKTCVPKVPLDFFITPNKLDNGYYINLQNGRGLFTSDQDLIRDNTTKNLVDSFAVNLANWKMEFGKAMVKMGNIEVLTGSAGQVRTNCRVVN